MNERIEATNVVYSNIGRKGNRDNHNEVNGKDNHENAGRKSGDTNIVPFIRGLIAADAIEGKGTAKEIAEAWNVSESTVNNVKNGKHTNAEKKNAHPEVLEVANRILTKRKRRKERIVDKTTKLLLEAMENINMSRFAKEKPLIQTAVMRNLASIADKMEEKTKDDEGNSQNVHFHVHTPVPLDVKLLPSVTINDFTVKK